MGNPQYAVYKLEEGIVEREELKTDSWKVKHTDLFFFYIHIMVYY